MQSNLSELENKIGYFFKNRSILKEATTHSSLRTANPNIKYYQRLEFFGDTVIQMAITEYLYRSMYGANVGTLSINREQLVCRKKQNEIANQLQLNRYIDKSPEIWELKRSDEFLEAIIGAVYADAGFGGQGLDAAKLVVYKLWKIQPSDSKWKPAFWGPMLLIIASCAVSSHFTTNLVVGATLILCFVYVYVV